MDASNAIAILAVLLGVLLTSALGLIAFMIRTIYGLQTKIAVLVETVRNFDQGATQGAQRLVGQLASRLDTTEDAVEQLGDRVRATETSIAVNTERLSRLIANS